MSLTLDESGPGNAALASRSAPSAPQASSRQASNYDRLSLGLFAATALIVLLTFRDYGVTWDEDVHFAYGFHVLDYYLSLFRDRTALSWLNLYYYGAAFDLVTAALAKISPIGSYETRHLVDAMTGIAGLVGTWKLARFLAGPRAGFCAAALLLLTPNYYGHMFNNPKDIPFAAAMIWAVYYLARLVRAAQRPVLADAAKFGLATGLALGVRIGGLLPLCYAGLAIPLAVAVAPGAWRTPVRTAVTGAGALARALVVAVAVAYPIMLFFWPWAQLDPIGNPYRALVEFSHHAFPYKTLFDGSYYPATDLPRSYLPVHIALKLPELVLLLALAAPAWGAARLIRGRVAPNDAVAFGLVGFAAVFPVVYAIAERAVLFDGMRHFLFVLPPIACLAGITLDRSFARLGGRMKSAVTVALGAYLAVHVSIMVRLHPDQYVYYNGLIGGVPGAAGRFKLDYWANSYDEAIGGLKAWVARNEPERNATGTYRVAVCGPIGSAIYYFPKNFIYEADREKADFYVAFTKDNCNRSIAGREIYRVERLDTLLSVVLDLRDRRHASIAPASPAGLGG